MVLTLNTYIGGVQWRVVYSYLTGGLGMSRIFLIPSLAQ